MISQEATEETEEEQVGTGAGKKQIVPASIAYPLQSPLSLFPPVLLFRNSDLIVRPFPSVSSAPSAVAFRI